MITIITGTPGAGKTLYTVEKLLQPLVGSTITYTDANGDQVTAPRTVYTNINGLLLDHEKIDGGENLGLRDWHKWAKPGAVIVFDEVQRYWVPRANGAKVPDDIQALETHRHMGVDFILVTQNVLLVDRNIHALAGRHLHVRRIASTHMAIVYEWDHVSRGLLYAKSLNKSPWRYSKKTFELYKSAEVHTKQPRKVPGLVWFIAAAAIGLSTLGPLTYARLTDRISGTKPATQQAAKTPASGIGAIVAPTPTPTPAAPLPDPNTATLAAARPPEPQPVFSGCVEFKTRCECYNTDGRLAASYDGICQDYTRKKPLLLTGGTFPDPPPISRPPERPTVIYPPPPPDDYGLERLRTALRAEYGVAPRP